jgi:hypothetical protein
LDLQGREMSKRSGKSQGGRTSLGGQTLEAVIRCIRLVGFTECTAKELRESRNDIFAEKQRLLVSHMPYTTIFGTQGRREYFIQSDEWTGELECKFQNTSGSVDEKMAYITETLKRTDLTRLAVVYGGIFWTEQLRGKAIIEWMKRESELIRQSHNKELLVMTLDEFIQWVQKTWTPA